MLKDMEQWSFSIQYLNYGFEISEAESDNDLWCLNNDERKLFFDRYKAMDYIMDSVLDKLGFSNKDIIHYRTKMYHKIDENYIVVHKNQNIILL